MPGATEGSRYGRRTWFVGGTQFAWVRPLTKADVRRLNGAPVPAGPIIGLVVADLAAKENLLGAGHRGVFTVSHFDGYPAVLDLLDERLAYAVEMFPRLGERMEQRAGSLSGGERQMVAMGRALMMKPTVLLLDEPSAGLAPALQDQVFIQCRRINESGVAILM
ncbi:MAG: ATP-binding cassette domain-containing protein, partial [Actinomycetota bacterium]